MTSPAGSPAGWLGRITACCGLSPGLRRRRCFRVPGTRQRGGGAAVDGTVSGQATAAVTTAPDAAKDCSSAPVCADDLPDGLVIADNAGRITVFNRAATRLTGIAARHALGNDICQVLPLRDIEGRCWWQYSRPYQGLATRTRHPERSLYLADGTELLVSIGYVRYPRGSRPREGWHRAPGAVRRLAVTSTLSAWKLARLTSKARARCVSGNWSSTASVCVPTASWWARCVARRPSTCCRP